MELSLRPVGDELVAAEAGGQLVEECAQHEAAGEGGERSSTPPKVTIGQGRGESPGRRTFRVGNVAVGGDQSPP